MAFALETTEEFQGMSRPVQDSLRTLVGSKYASPEECLGHIRQILMDDVGVRNPTCLPEDAAGGSMAVRIRYFDPFNQRLGDYKCMRIRAEA